MHLSCQVHTCVLVCLKSQGIKFLLYLSVSSTIMLNMQSDSEEVLHITFSSVIVTQMFRRIKIHLTLRLYFSTSPAEVTVAPSGDLPKQFQERREQKKKT